MITSRDQGIVEKDTQAIKIERKQDTVYQKFLYSVKKHSPIIKSVKSKSYITQNPINITKPVKSRHKINLVLQKNNIFSKKVSLLQNLNVSSTFQQTKFTWLRLQNEQFTGKSDDKKIYLVKRSQNNRILTTEKTQLLIENLVDLLYDPYYDLRSYLSEGQLNEKYIRFFIPGLTDNQTKILNKKLFSNLYYESVLNNTDFLFKDNYELSEQYNEEKFTPKNTTLISNSILNTETKYHEDYKKIDATKWNIVISNLENKSTDQTVYFSHSKSIMQHEHTEYNDRNDKIKDHHALSNDYNDIIENHNIHAHRSETSYINKNTLFKISNEKDNKTFNSISIKNKYFAEKTNEDQRKSINTNKIEKSVELVDKRNNKTIKKDVSNLQIANTINQQYEYETPKKDFIKYYNNNKKHFEYSKSYNSYFDTRNGNSKNPEKKYNTALIDEKVLNKSISFKSIKKSALKPCGNYISLLVDAMTTDYGIELKNNNYDISNSDTSNVTCLYSIQSVGLTDCKLNNMGKAIFEKKNVNILQSADNINIENTSIREKKLDKEISVPKYQNDYIYNENSTKYQPSFSKKDTKDIIIDKPKFKSNYNYDTIMNDTIKEKDEIIKINNKSNAMMSLYMNGESMLSSVFYKANSIETIEFKNSIKQLSSKLNNTIENLDCRKSISTVSHSQSFRNHANILNTNRKATYKLISNKLNLIDNFIINNKINKKASNKLVPLQDLFDNVSNNIVSNELPDKGKNLSHIALATRNKTKSKDKVLYNLNLTQVKKFLSSKLISKNLDNTQLVTVKSRNNGIKFQMGIKKLLKQGLYIGDKHNIAKKESLKKATDVIMLSKRYDIKQYMKNKSSSASAILKDSNNSKLKTSYIDASRSSNKSSTNTGEKLNQNLKNYSLKFEKSNIQSILLSKSKESLLNLTKVHTELDNKLCANNIYNKEEGGKLYVKTAKLDNKYCANKSSLQSRQNVNTKNAILVYNPIVVYSKINNKKLYWSNQLENSASIQLKNFEHEIDIKENLLINNRNKNIKRLQLVEPKPISTNITKPMQLVAFKKARSVSDEKVNVNRTVVLKNVSNILSRNDALSSKKLNHTKHDLNINITSKQNNKNILNNEMLKVISKIQRFESLESENSIDASRVLLELSKYSIGNILDSNRKTTELNPLDNGYIKKFPCEITNENASKHDFLSFKEAKKEFISIKYSKNNSNNEIVRDLDYKIKLYSLTYKTKRDIIKKDSISSEKIASVIATKSNDIGKTSHRVVSNKIKYTGQSMNDVVSKSSSDIDVNSSYKKVDSMLKYMPKFNNKKSNETNTVGLTMTNETKISEEVENINTNKMKNVHNGSEKSGSELAKVGYPIATTLTELMYRHKCDSVYKRKEYYSIYKNFNKTIFKEKHENIAEISLINSISTIYRKSNQWYLKKNDQILKYIDSQRRINKLDTAVVEYTKAQKDIDRSKDKLSNDLIIQNNHAMIDIAHALKKFTTVNDIRSNIFKRLFLNDHNYLIRNEVQHDNKVRSTPGFCPLITSERLLGKSYLYMRKNHMQKYDAQLNKSLSETQNERNILELLRQYVGKYGKAYELEYKTLTEFISNWTDELSDSEQFLHEFHNSIKQEYKSNTRRIKEQSVPPMLDDQKRKNYIRIPQHVYAIVFE